MARGQAWSNKMLGAIKSDLTREKRNQSCQVKKNMKSEMKNAFRPGSPRSLTLPSHNRSRNALQANEEAIKIS